jgi:hypothetical protein
MLLRGCICGANNYVKARWMLEYKHTCKQTSKHAFPFLGVESCWIISCTFSFPLCGCYPSAYDERVWSEVEWLRVEERAGLAATWRK